MLVSSASQILPSIKAQLQSQMESQQIALSLRFFDDSSEEQAADDKEKDMLFSPPSASELDQISIISDYLAFQYLKPFSQGPSQQIQSDPHERLAESTENSKEAQNGAQINRSKNKSMFHNLQKHLITFLKRIVYLKRVDLMNHPGGLKAYQLWKIFKTCKDCSKKSLYIIVGSSEVKKRENMKKIARSLPELQKILKKTDFADIQQAQDLLRDNIHKFLASIPKNVIRERCKMSKFDEFYSYLLNFMEELKGEGVSMRMKKQQKEKMLHQKITHSPPGAPPKN